MIDELLRDILDEVGRAPRELCGVHLHAEPVRRSGSGAARAVLWLQAAVDPLHPSTLSVDYPGRGAQVAALPIPRLDEGRVIRWTLPLQLTARTPELLFRIDGRVDPEASRIRPAWKLSDTIEMVREEQVSTGDEGVGLGLGAVDMPFSRSIGGFVGGEYTVSETFRLKRHAARQLPDGFVAEVIDDAGDCATDAGVELVWDRRMTSFDPGPWRTKPANGSERMCACGAIIRRGAEFCHCCLAAV